MLGRLQLFWGLLLILITSLEHVNGHAAMMIPISRNAFDRVLPGFENGTTKSTPCTCANNGPCELGKARDKGGAGQPCLWWSQGCSIGCDFCMTDPMHPANNGSIPTKDVLPKEYWTMNIHAIPRAEN